VTAAALDNFGTLDPAGVPTPCYVIDQAKLTENLSVLRSVADAAGARVLLALKAFSCPHVADLIGAHLHGTAASGLYEARLGRDLFPGAVHTFAPGVVPRDLPALLQASDHLIFNSLNSWAASRPGLLEGSGNTHFGLRINPRQQEAENPLYDPCGPASRLGATAAALAAVDGIETHFAGAAECWGLDGAAGGGLSAPRLSGLHVHALCDQGLAPLARVLTAIEAQFADRLEQVSWLNLGGGHLITAPDYDRDGLVALLRGVAARHNVEVILEPGTAAVLNAGALVCEVLDVGSADGHVAVVDASATCHMPDVIEGPYTPDIWGAQAIGREAPCGADAADPCVVRIGGPTCLAGDVFGTYRFDRPLAVGDRLVIRDAAYYTMVKTTTFNGTPLPAIALWEPGTEPTVVRTFGEASFRERLG